MYQITKGRTDSNNGWGQQLELKITKKEFTLEPICKDYNHSVDVNEFDECNSDSRNIEYSIEVAVLVYAE